MQQNSCQVMSHPARFLIEVLDGEHKPMQWEPRKQYLISYANESLETSVRTIDVIQTSRSGDGLLYIRAFCHLRGMERTFRADGVIQAERVLSASTPPSSSNASGQ